MSESLRSVLIQELRTKFPAVSWKVGSLVRELVIEPLARIGDILETYIQQSEARLDITTALDDPTNNKDTIDLWMDRLGLGEFEGKPSSGSIAIMSESMEDMTILQGTVFTYGADEISLITDATITAGSDGTGYKKCGEGAYLVEVPVTSADTESGYISPGVPVNWVGAPQHVYDIYTATSISGGRPAQSYIEKAELIRDALSMKSFVGEECIKGALRRAFPGEIADTRVVQTNSTSTPAAVNICVKPSSPPSTFDINAMTSQDTVNGPIYVTINNPGILRITDVLASDEESRQVNIVRVDKSPLDNGGTAHTIILSGVEPSALVTVKCEGSAVIGRCGAWLNQSVQGLPFKYNVLLPCIATLSLRIPSNDTINIGAKSAIQAYVNSKAMDSEITDADIVSILREYGINTTGSIIYSKTVSNGSGAESMVTTVGSVRSSSSGNSDGKPTAVFTFIDKITNN